MAWGGKDKKANAALDAIENMIGRSAFVRGDLEADGAFRIDGQVEGKVSSKGAVVIGDGGVVRGDVSGRDVVVAGKVHGNVSCRGHLEIVSTGLIEGDIEASSFRVETGGVFRGTSRMGAPSDGAEAEEDPQRARLASVG